MNKDNKPAQSGHNNNSSPKKPKQSKNERLAAALRANLRRRKIATSSAGDIDAEESI